MYNRERYLELKEKIYNAYAELHDKKREELSGFDIWSIGFLSGMHGLLIARTKAEADNQMERKTEEMAKYLEHLEDQIKKRTFDENQKMTDNITNGGQTTSSISSGDYSCTTITIPTNSTIDYFYKVLGGPVREYKDFGFNDLVNYGSYNFVDISGESYRTYKFPEGDTITIDNPVALAVSESGHRLFDNLGKCHFIPNGWRQLTWEVRPGEPHFVK